MSDASFRALHPDDLPTLQRIRQRAFAPVFASFAAIVGEAIAQVAFARADAEQAELLAKLCVPGAGRHVMVAEFTGAAVGFACLSADAATRIGEIGLNAVDPDHAGKGIGTAMYEAALVWMTQQGMAIATVGTGGDPSHAPARRAYQKAGFGTPIPSVTLYRMLEPAQPAAGLRR